MLRRFLEGFFALAYRFRFAGDPSGLRTGGRVWVCSLNAPVDLLLILIHCGGRPLVVLPRDLQACWVGRFASRLTDCLDPATPGLARPVLDAIRAGRQVLLFPEDRVTGSGSLGKVYRTAGAIVARARAEVVPLVIAGTEATTRRRALRHPVTLTVLPARALAHAGGSRRRRHADAMLRLLQAAHVEAQPDCALFDALRGALTRFGVRHPALCDSSGQRLTLGQLTKGALALGRLTATFTRPGEKIGVMMPNVNAALALLFGLWGRGRVPAMLNFTGGVESFRGSCALVGLRTIITSRQFVARAKAQALLDAVPDVRVVYLEDLRAALGVRDLLWILRARLLPGALPPVDPAETALIMFTSGSEAQPKGVALSHRGVMSGMHQLRAVIDFGPDDRFLDALPLYHVFGLIACGIMPVLHGARVVFYPNPLHYKVIPEVASREECTYVFGTGTFLGHYGRQAHDYDFHRARYVIAGGEKLNPVVSQLWQKRFGRRVHEGYGATECAPAMALNTSLAFREGSVGRLLPAIEHRIVPLPGIEAGGVLHVRAPNLMQGYFLHDRPGELQPPRSEVGEGWYNTGDIVSIDDDGFLTIIGRVKRFAKVAGEMVSLERIEQIAYHAAPAFKHAALVEMTGNGESTVLMTTDPALDRTRLLQAARELHAQDLAVARRIMRVDNLPLLGTGKVDYVTLSKLVIL